MRRTLTRALFAVAVVLVAYGAVAALLLANRHALIYPFQPGPSVQLSSGERMVRLDGAPAVQVWLSAPQADAPVILYFLGNGGRLADAQTRMRAMAAQGYGFAVLAYRGGAGQPGAPSEAGLVADAQRLDAQLNRLMGQVVPPGRRVYWGTSLGAAVATALATTTQTPPAGLVIEAGFTRLCAAAQAAYPLFPACWLMWDEGYNTAQRLRGLQTDVLVLHGARDQVIPVAHARINGQSAPNATLRLYPEGQHMDLPRYGALDHIRDFVERVTRAGP